MGAYLAREWRAINGKDGDDDDQRQDNQYNAFENRLTEAPTPANTPSKPDDGQPPRSGVFLTPLDENRLRVLQEDPRSPSGSISRTPIEVLATPDPKKQQQQQQQWVEFSPSASPARGDSPQVGLLKKQGGGGGGGTANFQKRIFQRNPPKMLSYENDGGEDQEN